MNLTQNPIGTHIILHRKGLGPNPLSQGVLQNKPQQICKSQHLCQAIPTLTPIASASEDKCLSTTRHHQSTPGIFIDLDYTLSPLEKKFCEFSNVFESDLIGYNGSSSHFGAIINKCPTQPF